jgi:phosphoribosyl-ATP pyrophosphohydrolase/phosphoribosyl-AMP cyclohydrolase
MLNDQTIESLKWDDDGLIPAIIQDVRNGRVLMLAYMNRKSLTQTIKTGQTVFWSRSRQELWHKGATSGNIQTVEEVFVDCDADTILIKVNPAGPACHTGEMTCFFSSLSSILTAEGATDV